MAVEMVDIIDLDDNVVRTVTRKQMRQEQLPHRASYILMVDSAGRILVEVRTLTKDYAPGMFDPCVGGVVQHGEDGDITAEREVAEEVGVNIKLSDPNFHSLGKIAFEHHDFDGFTMAYLYLLQGDFITVRQASEVSGIMYLSPEELTLLKDQCTVDSYRAFEEILRRARERGIAI